MPRKSKSKTSRDSMGRRKCRGYVESQDLGRVTGTLVEEEMLGDPHEAWFSGDEAPSSSSSSGASLPPSPASSSTTRHAKKVKTPSRPTTSPKPGQHGRPLTPPSTTQPPHYAAISYPLSPPTSPKATPKRSSTLKTRFQLPISPPATPPASPALRVRSSTVSSTSSIASIQSPSSAVAPSQPPRQLRRRVSEYALPPPYTPSPEYLIPNVFPTEYHYEDTTEEDEEMQRRVDIANIVLSVVMAIGAAGLAVSFLGDKRREGLQRQVEDILGIGKKLGLGMEWGEWGEWVGRGVGMAHVVKKVEKWVW
ncbi:hypothetical protein EX30DRAFT_371612 [Ascodesmis nigricans]|uniref:Uncharacterized protein n=1 Tax=Ascodesmis nigricans TaxID=341454 RepID=A0A4S2MXF4_9PEZI|nr:hypothetical protein EX30DRAFT_371612 [Ascodesmis nigricans]